MAFVLPNLVFGVASGSFTDSQTTLDLQAGHGARFGSSFDMTGVLWNWTDYKNPAEARWDGSSDLEIVLITGRSGDQLTLTRGQEGVPAIPSKAGREFRIAVAATSAVFTSLLTQPFQTVSGVASTTIDWESGSRVRLNLAANITTLTLNNPEDGRQYLLRILQDGAGNRTITWPASVKWKGGLAPTLGGPNVIDVVALIYNSTDSEYLADAGLEFS